MNQIHWMKFLNAKKKLIKGKLFEQQEKIEKFYVKENGSIEVQKTEESLWTSSAYWEYWA